MGFHMRRPRYLLILLLFVAVMAGAVVILRQSGAPAAQSAQRSPNVILISLDTLRADRLGAYGYGRPTSPFLDELAARGVLFEHAVSPAPWTLPSHLSIFTGLYPGSHGVNTAAEKRVGDEVKLLTEILREHGYRTFGFHGGGYVGERYGFERGFETYQKSEADKGDGKRGFPALLNTALTTLDTLAPEESFFLFLHTYAVHCPYAPEEPYASMFVTPGAVHADPRYCGVRSKKLGKITKEQALYLSDRYDGSIRQADEDLKRFFGALDSRGKLANTLVIVLSDHGEEFLEHGRIGHQESLYKELLMVPLIISGPGISHRRVEQPVNLVDVFPSLLELLGIADSPAVDGHSFTPLLLGAAERADGELQFSELERGKRLRSLIDPRREHFIHDLESAGSELFDLRTDPLELYDLGAAHPQRVDALRDELRTRMQRQTKRETEETDSASPEHLEQLKTLGYL